VVLGMVANIKAEMNILLRSSSQGQA